MTQVFTESGEVVSVTVVDAGPCYITQIKTDETDGYSAIQVGYKEKKPQRTSKPLKGHFKKVDFSHEGPDGEKIKPDFQALHYLREFRVDDTGEYTLGGKIDVEIFEKGDLVDVTGYSKGRGFAGVMKRWNFQGGPKSHGAMCDRRPGAIGMHSDPSRVFKGKKMAGHYGNERITIKNTEVIGIVPEKNLLLLKGPIPGARNGLLYIRTAKTGVPKKQPADAE